MSDDEFQDCVDNEIPQEPASNGPPVKDAEGYTCYTKDGYDYKIPRSWSFDEIFSFETEALADVFSIKCTGNTAMTAEMQTFQPTDLVMKYG
jgi:hypothetical protein